MSVLLAFLDLTGMLAFIVAAKYSYNNNAAMSFASNVWFYFATASVIGAVWSFIVLLEETKLVLPGNAEPSLFFAVVFLFTLFSVISFFNFIKPLESK